MMVSGDTLYLLVVLCSLCCPGECACPSNCRNDQTCDDADFGCPLCNGIYYGRQCQYPAECRYSQLGTEYRGLRNTTELGKTCQRWESQTPHPHTKRIRDENYCRNPDNEPYGPWCYTIDPSSRFEFCGIPMCSDQCPLPTLFVYGDVINPPSNGFEIGFVVEEIAGGCGPGKQGKRTCESDKTWSTAFDCIELPWCSAPYLNDTRYIDDTTGDYFFDSSINIQCIDGFEITGNPQITCQGDKTWTDIPQCTRVNCSAPVLKENSKIRPKYKKQKYVYEDEITIQCDIGYETEQKTSFICQADRQWNGEMPECSVIHCEEPQLNENSVVTNEKQFYVYQNVINITCITGYILIGETTATCQANKTWDVQFPVCIPVPCEKPTLPANSTNILGNVSFVFQDTITIECIKGMLIKTNNVITCLADQTWGTIPVCTIVVCEPPTLTPNVRIIAGKFTTYQYLDSVTLGCDEGYRYEGLSTSVCLHTGLWEETGSYCASKSTGDHGVTIGATVGALGAIVIGLVIAFIIVKKRKRKGTKYKKNSLKNVIVQISPSVEERQEPSKSSATRDRTKNNETSENKHTSGIYLNMSLKEAPEEDMYQNAPSVSSSRSILVTELPEFVLSKMADNSFFENEFSELLTGLQRPASEACKQTNKGKNKYKNMYPYDDNRIFLTKKPGVQESDYINASPIHGYDGGITYIAAQGPIKTTLDDFWRMVWELNSGRVVMLTNPTEEGRMKCLVYWPEEEATTAGNITIEHIDTKEYADFIIRHLSISNGNSRRRLLQYHYTVWPDKGVPKSASSLVHFRRKIISTPTGADGPTVVHCSAGIGRTGTFIALDYLIREAQATGSVNVFRCVQRLREQRVNMVQTKDQYVLLYRMLVEEYELKKSLIDSSDFLAKYKKLTTQNPSTGKTYIQEEFEVLLKTEAILVQGDFRDGKLPVNKTKNRYTNVLPADSYRPYLSGDGNEDQNYINAVYLPSYRDERAYLVTQMPLPNTVADFLSLVYEQDVSVIVMLNTTQDKSCGIYWPKDDKGPAQFGSMSVSLLREDKIDKLIIKTLQLERNKSEARTVEVYQMTDWPETKFVPSTESLHSIVDRVEAAMKNKQKTPIVVHCMNGADKSGLFCTILAIFDRLIAEQDVAIVPIIKQMRSRRPQIIPNMEQFTFCYEMVYQRLLGSGSIYSN